MRLKTEWRPDRDSFEKPVREKAPESFHGDEGRIGQICYGHYVHYTPSWHNERSRKAPHSYGKDIHKVWKELITGAFDNPENDSANKVCQQIAEGVKDAMNATENGRTFMVAIMNMETLDYLEDKSVMKKLLLGTGGYYMEYQLNEYSYLIIKSTY